jgi:Ca2+-binding RTX toxin-like protein
MSKIVTIGFDNPDGGTDMIVGGSDNEVIFGGGGGDTIYAGGGSDLVFGDQGEIETQNDHPFDPTTSLRPVCWDLFPTQGFLHFEAIHVDQSTGSGDDLVYGQAGDDVILGQQGADVLYGNDGDDILIGGSNVAGGLDETTASTVAAVGCDRRRQCRDVLPPGSARLRECALTGTQIYGTTPGVDDGLALVDTLVANVPEYRDPRGYTQYHIELLDHSDDIQANHTELFGNDYVAGGAGEDEIFGQLGNDVIQGDGKIGTDPRTDLTIIVSEGAPTAFAAYRDGTTNDDSSLVVTPSFESATDGDDYIEGNGGNDVVFGNLGQDDILGGSSDLYNLTAPEQRPDGNDLIFGGAGTDIARNDIGDATVDASGNVTVNPSGHAIDADTIVGDNGRILRLVGVSGVQVATTATGRPGIPAPAAISTSSTTTTPPTPIHTYDRMWPEVEHLDYTPGGILYDDRAAQDRGGADELHGESGDDVLYSQKGNDVLYGEGQDDDAIGGYGHDWISGGTGNDAVIGDDGRIMTSRNSTIGEPLYGIAGLLANDPDPKNANGNVLNEYIKTPGTIQEATNNVEGELKKSVNLTPFSIDVGFSGQFDEFVGSGPKQNDPLLHEDEGHYSDDIIYGGLGNDALHGGSGDDAISGGEALLESFLQVYDAAGQLTGIARSDYGHPLNTGDVLRFNPEDPDGWHKDPSRRAGEFALYDEYDPRRKILLETDGTAAHDDNAAAQSARTKESNPAGTISKPTGQTR